MKETIVCIKTGFEYYWTAEPRFTKDKKYFVMHDSEQSIQVLRIYREHKKDYSQ